MNRKLVGGLAALILVAIAIWFFAFRGDKTAKKAEPKGKTPTANVKAKAPEKTASDQAAPKGMAPRWQLDIDPEGPLRLEGQVVAADGHGVGGAEVQLSSVPPRTAKTEDDGTFAFDKLVGRKYALTASTGDSVGGPIEYKLTETSDPVVIRLVAGAKLVVTVSDDAGKPIEGADVKLASMTERGGKTGADGVATLKPVHPGWVSVQASATGYAPNNAFMQLNGAGSTGSLKVTLHKGFAVTGRVVDENRKPIAKVEITTSGIWDIPGGIDPVTTDAKGEFSIPALAPGSHVLVATDGEHAPARSAPVTVGERAVTGVEIVMRDGGVLSGTVVDDAGKPVPYATVRVGGDAPQMNMVASRQATTDKAGAFELKGLTRGKLKARAESDVAASAIATVDLTTEVAKKDLKLVLDVKGVIAGAVVDETGQPVAEVQVNAFPDILGGEAPEAIALAGLSSATTDGAGRFSIRGLPEGGYRVRAARASGAGGYDWGQQGVAAKTGDKNVKITLTAPGSIVGKIVIDGGTVPKLATVSLGYQAQTTTHEDGTFTLEDVTAGKHDLKVHGPEFAEFSKLDIDVTPGKPTDVGTITVTRGRKLAGKVVDDKGNAVPGAKVKVGDMLYTVQGAEEQLDSWEEMAGGKSSTTDQDGRFTLIGIGKKRTSVMADHPARGRSNAVEVPEGTDDPPQITLAIHGYGSVTGKVTSQGKAVGGVTISDTPKGGGSQVQIAQSEADGTFTLNKVTEGTHVLSAMQQGGFGTSLKSTSTTVQVTSGKETKVTIDIPVGTITLAVTVKALPNNKVDSAQIFLFRGVIAPKSAKELTEGFLAGGVQGMKFWFGEGKPPAEFDELVAGTFSVCTIPITGDLSDSTFQQRLQAHSDVLKVYCKQAKVAPSPVKQTFLAEVPAMEPLPTN